MYRFAAAVTAMLVAAVASMVAGCQPSSPPPSTPTGPPPSSSPASPVPTPTYLCTPEAGGEETPCSQRQYDEMKAKDALYAEAETVYREFFAESVRISRDGGVDQPTQTLLDTTAGDYLDNMMDIFISLHNRGVRAEGKDPRLTIARLPGVSKAGSIVALTVCVDAREWAFFTGSEQTSQGRVGIDEVHFARFDRDLKIIGADGREAVSCDL